MNVYDTANRLAKEMRESEEYKNYKKAKDEIKEKPELNEKLKKFEQMRYDIQMAAMQGKEAIDGKTEEMQNLYAELVKDEFMKNYFDVEFKFNVMLGDVNKIIGEAVRDILM